MYTRAKLQLADGTFTGQTAKQTISLHNTGSTAASATFDALVLPITAADGPITFSFNVGGNTYTSTQTVNYASAKAYRLNFALDFSPTATLLNTSIIPRNEETPEEFSVDCDTPCPNNFTPANDWNAVPYVGTFHRWNQVGERVLSGLNSGDWSATVTYGNFVTLSTSKSLDPNFYTNTPGDPENFQVTGGSQSVSGTGDIYLRIGLTSKLASATTAPRYAIVKLTSGGTTKNIYVRQGEADDYVMGPNDATNSGGMTQSTRPCAVKFSPYNITDPAGNTSTVLFTSGLPTAGIALNGGKFVDYPTQSGYMFRWNYSRQAFSPYIVPAIPGWALNQYGSGDWDASQMETCPTGYRRPNDGGQQNAAGAVDGSEVRQSLWSDPLAGGNATSNSMTNSAWGYYADGFFDRRPLVDAPGGGNTGIKSSVSIDNNLIANVGRVFFNPNNNASLFLPAAGSRYTDGSLWGVGVAGFYWASSSNSNSSAWSPYVTSTRVCMNIDIRSGGYPIRCVVQ